MTDVVTAPSGGSPPDLTKIGIAVVAAVVMLLAAVAAMRSGAGIDASVGNVKFTVKADDSLADILGKAIEKDEATVTALLAGRGFFRPTDQRIVREIENLDPADPEDAAVVNALRQMLWNLSGPFRLPDTMIRADARLVTAIEEQSATPADPARGLLLAELIRLSLDRSSIFEVRQFPAQLQPLEPLAGPLAGNVVTIATCPGSELIGKQAQIWGGGRTVYAEIVADVRLSPGCAGTARTIQALLQGKEGLFGIPPAAYEALTAAAGTGGAASPTFTLNPVDLAPPLVARGVGRMAGSTRELGVVLGAAGAAAADCYVNGQWVDEGYRLGSQTCRGGEWVAG